MKFLPFIWRNLMRNPARTLLTGGAIALAISLVCLLRTMPAGLDAILDEFASNTRIVVHNEAGIVYPVPYAYLQKVRALPGVVSAASWTWFGGVFEGGGAEFPSFAVEPDAFSEVWADWEMDPKGLEDFRRYRDAAFVGRGTLRRYGWKIGDLVTLRGTLFPVDLQFRIVGEIPSDRVANFMFQREHLDQALRALGSQLDFCDTMWLRVDDPSHLDALMLQIDEMFHNSAAQTVSATEKSFFKSLFSVLQGFVAMILLVTGLVTLVIVFIAANTASMNVRERFHEIAVLRAIGFKRTLIFGTLLAEATLLSTLAGAAGAVASLGLTTLLRSRVKEWDPQLGPLGNFIVTDVIFVQGLFIGLFIGIVSGVVPSFGAVRRSVTATLRETF